jgi:diacylglycerol kinase family enzyme
MLCGLGFDAQVAHDFAEQKTRGLSTYVKQTVKNFLTAIPYPFIIKLNDLEIKTEAFFISIANSNQFGNHVTIAPKASLNDGFLDIVIVKKMSKIRMLYSLLMQIKLGQITNTEKKYHQKDIFYFQTKQLLIENPKHAPLHIDGEPATTARHFEINVVEKAFRLLQP